MSERCPFIDPEYELENHKPCPVCGMFGLGPTDDEDKCVGDGVDIAQGGTGRPRNPQEVASVPNE